MDIGRRTFLASAVALTVLRNPANAQNASEDIALWPDSPPMGLARKSGE